MFSSSPSISLLLSSAEEAIISLNSDKSTIKKRLRDNIKESLKTPHALEMAWMLYYCRKLRGEYQGCIIISEASFCAVPEISTLIQIDWLPAEQV